MEPLLPWAPIMAAARWEFEEEAGEGELSAIDGEFIGMEGEFKADKVGEGWEPDWYWGGPGAHPGGPPV